jgi:hypothetical protein
MGAKTYAEYEGAITKDDIWLITVTFATSIAAIVVVALTTITTGPRCCRVVYLDIPFAAPTAPTVSPIMNAHRHCAWLLLHLYRTEERER